MGEVIARGGICGGFIPARYILAILGSIAMAITYALKVNLSTAMLGMLNHTAIKNHDIILNVEQHHQMNLNITDVCNTETNNETLIIEDGPFAWSETLQGIILSSYFWGYIVFQVPGGRIAEIFSAKWVMFASVAINIICTILTPVFARLHYSTMIIMRIGEGLGGAVTFPAMHVLLARWAPPAERSIMSSIVYAGTCLGTVISILSAGVIASTLGWEFVFYIMGGVCIPWCILWAFIIADTPEQQRYINQEERNLISQSLGLSFGNNHQTKQARKVPWRSVFTSKEFWAILIAHMCNNWGWYMVLIELPFYMKQVLHFNMQENAVLNAIPYLTMWLFSILLSKILDKLRVSNIIKTTSARKIATGIASFIPGVCLIAVCYIGCIRWLAVLLMTIAVTAKAGMFSGFLSNHIDIAPNFAGTLVALTNTMATIPGIIVPIFVGNLTHGNQTIDAWRIIFFVTVILYIIEIIVYTIFGSGDEQPWNRINTDEHEEQPLNQTNTAYKSTEQN